MSRKAKKVMEETRLAFLVDLWKLRGLLPQHVENGPNDAEVTAFFGGPRLVGRVRRAVEVEEAGWLRLLLRLL